MSLQDRLNELKEGFQKKAPKEALEIMHRATEDLKASGIMDRAVKIGDRAPEFVLNSSKGEKVGLKEQLSAGPVVLAFFRGKW